MSRDLKPCPFCEKPLAVRGGVNPYGRCETPDCWTNERKVTVPLDDPRQVGAWNTRAELSSLRGEGEGSDVIGRLVGALERIRHRADGWVPEEGFEARIAWIEAELDDEPNRMPYGDGITPPCRNGYEVSELLAEHAGLVARQALASIPSTTIDSQQEARVSPTSGG